MTQTSDRLQQGDSCKILQKAAGSNSVTYLKGIAQASDISIVVTANNDQVIKPAFTIEVEGSLDDENWYNLATIEYATDTPRGTTFINAFAYKANYIKASIPDGYAPSLAEEVTVSILAT